MGKNPIIALVVVVAALAVGLGFYLHHKSANQPAAVPDFAASAPVPPPVTVAPPIQKLSPTLSNTAVAAGPTSVPSLDSITASLTSDNTADQKRALAAIHMLAANPPDGMTAVIAAWSQPLLDARQFTDLEAISPWAIYDKPHDLANVEIAQQSLVKALIADNNYSQALMQAKALYDIAQLEHTQAAVDLMVQVLSMKDPKEAEQFKQRQVLAAAANADNIDVTTRPSAGPDPVLSAINVDGSFYDSAVTNYQAKLNKPSNTGLRALGNLLLVMDRPAEAQPLFAQAARIKFPKQNDKLLRQSVAGIACAMRDQDGNVTRANRFIALVGAKSPAAMSLIGPATDGASDSDIFTVVGKQPIAVVR